jgi:hypothetical protein
MRIPATGRRFLPYRGVLNEAERFMQCADSAGIVNCQWN